MKLFPLADGKKWNRESLLQNPNVLQVALEDLQNFDDELCERLRTMPADYLPPVPILNELIFPYSLPLSALLNARFHFTPL